jgi:hypothetical protein
MGTIAGERIVSVSLWDMHVHLGKATAAVLPQLLAARITGVRDMGSPSREVR